MNTVKKPNTKPESYSPSEEPEVVSNAKKLFESKKYDVYKDMPYRFDMLELPETLKITGIARKHDWSFANIKEFHKNYSEAMKEKYLPYVELGVTSNIKNTDADYIYGCIVDSLDDIPDGLYSFDTGLKKFAVMTFRANNAEELVASDKHGMSLAYEYLAQHWIPENKNIVIELNDYFQFKNDYNGKTCDMSIFEVYKCDIQNEPEMSFYIPLK